MQREKHVARLWVGSLLLGAVGLVALPRQASAEINCFDEPEKCEATFHATRLKMRASPVSMRNIVPSRGLALQSGQGEATAGVAYNIKDAFGLPLSYSHGFGDKLEVGGGLDLFFYKFHATALISNLNVYGRYVIIPEMFALQATLDVAGAIGEPSFVNLDIDAPFLFKLLSQKLWIFAQPKLSLGVQRLTDDFYMRFALGATVMYLITEKIFANIETELSFIFTPEFLAPYADTPFPLGFGGGYMLTGNMGGRLNILFPDLTDFDAHGVTFLLSGVYFI